MRYNWNLSHSAHRWEHNEHIMQILRLWLRFHSCYYFRPWYRQSKLRKTSSDFKAEWPTWWQSNKRSYSLNERQPGGRVRKKLHYSITEWVLFFLNLDLMSTQFQLKFPCGSILSRNKSSYVITVFLHKKGLESFNVRTWHSEIFDDALLWFLNKAH